MKPARQDHPQCGGCLRRPSVLGAVHRLFTAVDEVLVSPFATLHCTRSVEGNDSL